MIPNPPPATIDDLYLSTQKIGDAIHGFGEAMNVTMAAIARDIRRTLGDRVALDDPEPMSRAERRAAASRKAQRARRHNAGEQRTIAQERRGWIT